MNEQELFIEAQSIIKVTETGHMRLGLICRQVEEQHLWTNHLDPETGQQCHSFGRWLRILAPRAYSTCYQAIDDVKALSDIPEEDLAQIPASNAKTMIKLSTKVRNEPATLKAAKTLRNAEFIEQIQRTHPDQCIERSKIKRFVLEESALEMVNRTLQMALVRGAKNESDALEMMAAEAAESWRAEDEVLEAAAMIAEEKATGVFAMTMRRYNLVPKVIGQPTNYEWEAADDGIAVQADEAIREMEGKMKAMTSLVDDLAAANIRCVELERVADEMADALQLTFEDCPVENNCLECETTRAALASYARVKGGM